MTASAVCIVQARTGSTRLPGKVLQDLGGRPLLAFLLDRLSALHVDSVIVATSVLDRDDSVAHVAAQAGVPCVRGPEGDVLARFVAALDAHPAEAVVRITADCPLTDPKLVEAVLEVHRKRDADYTSNVLPRTFPKGLDVEVARAAALRMAADEAVDPAEREHVMPFLYRHPERFALANLTSDADLGDERWTVDTLEDLEAVRAIVERLDPEAFAGWREILRLTGRRMRPARGRLRLRPVNAADVNLLLQWRNDPESVRFSESGRPVAEMDHRDWFASRLGDPSTRIWIAERDHCPLGSVRIDVRAAVGAVSIAVAPEARGQGVGREILRLLQQEVGDDFQVAALTAVVREDNVASLRLFERAGFRLMEDRGRFLQLTWPKVATDLHEDRR